jgi:hypothetical protein
MTFHAKVMPPEKQAFAKLTTEHDSSFPINPQFYGRSGASST